MAKEYIFSHHRILQRTRIDTFGQGANEALESIHSGVTRAWTGEGKEEQQAIPMLGHRAYIGKAAPRASKI